MNHPNTPPSAPLEALDSSDISELVDHSAVQTAMAEIDDILKATARDPAPADAEARSSSAVLPAPSASSQASAVGSDVSPDDIDSLVPPTPDFDLPIDVAVLLELDTTERVLATPLREISSDESSRYHDTPHSPPVSAVPLVQLPSPSTSGHQSPRSMLQRVRALRLANATGQAKKLLSPRRPSHFLSRQRASLPH